MSVRMPVCSREHGGGGSGRGEADAPWPPSCGPGRVRARMAVVFPAPAGAIASCSRAPEVAICRTRAACPALRAVPFAAVSSSARSTAVCVDGVSVAAAGGGDEALLGVEDPRARCTGRRRRRCRPTTPSARRSSSGSSMPSSGAGEGDRPAVEDLVDQQVDERVGLLGGHVGGADLALRLGADVPDLPGRAAFLHRRQDPIGGLARPSAASTIVAVLRRRAERRRAPSTATASGPPSTAAASAEPGRALLGQGAGFVLGVAGLQGGLLGQLQRFDRGRWPAVVVLELGWPARRGGPRCGRGGSTSAGSVAGSTPTISRTGRLRRVGAGPFGEPHARACRGGAAPGRCCRSPTRRRWP